MISFIDKSRIKADYIARLDYAGIRGDTVNDLIIYGYACRSGKTVVSLESGERAVFCDVFIHDPVNLRS